MKAEGSFAFDGVLVVGFIVWVLRFGPKSWGSVWLSVSEGLFIYYGLGFFTLALI